MSLDDSAGITADEDISLIEVQIADVVYHLSLAEEEFNSEKKTLFATYLWPAAQLLSNYLVKNPHIVKNKRVIEFGAGAALPSLVSASLDARAVCITDYPVPCIIDNINANINRNFHHKTYANIKVLGYIWGSDVSTLIDLESNEKDDDDHRYYDVAIACECIWKPDSHEILLSSLSQVLNSNSLALIAYSIHIPSLEEAYMNFFTLATTYGLQTMETISFEGKHMWSEKNVPIYITILRKC